MKKPTKKLRIIFLIGIAGLIITVSIGMGTGSIMSYENTKEYQIGAGFNAVELNIQKAQIDVVAAQNEYLVEAYTKAWSSGKLDLDAMVKIKIEDKVLKITEIAPPSEFLGLFPQPYELKLKLYVPKEVYKDLEGMS